MNPAFHEGRRKDRPEALQARYTGRQDVLYTDAAEYESKAAHTSVAVREDGTLMAVEGSREMILLFWAPAHQGLRGNGEAHSVARGLTCRIVCNLSTWGVF
ncbi:hypothetical protein HPB52_009658 [Rhipicephalus sanguineus]|uniref:Uncharacterized protein n=1 Tax=Rhipicephalus sanguineus TaxID=34632 RepID=A0A9D4YNN6_RHISA|nr:hypothetical protein HPB52_009658 [Rhipicephalus sanguineus]